VTYKLHATHLGALFAIEPGLKAASSETLSLYLPVRKQGFDARPYEILLKQAEERYRPRLDKNQRKILDSELPRLRDHLNLIRPAGCPGVAMFGEEGVALLTLIRLPESVEPRIAIGPPLLAPFELLLRRHPPSLIVVVGKEEARTFAAVLGEVIALGHLEGQDVRHIKSGGTSAPSNQRKADNRARANLKKVVELVENEVRRGYMSRIFLAGPEEARAMLLREMPRPLASIVAGTLSGAVELPPGDLLVEIREQIVRLEPAAAPNGAATTE
jgi:hypothetical protein